MHLVGSVDVVLYKNGNAVERRADLAFFSLDVHLVRDRKRVRVELEDGVRHSDRVP